MEKKDKIKITFTISCLAIVSILLANKFRKQRKRKQSICSCYLKSEAKPQHNFKCVLANNSYFPFKHLKLEDDNSTDLHLFESEIKALLEKLKLEFEFYNGTMDMDMRDAYVWVDDESKLKELAQVLSKERVFAVDTEQHSLRSFLGFTALIQISTKNEDYLVDTIAVHDFMGILRPVFANPYICKVFHGADNDIIWLQRDFHIYVVNLFDTAKACDVLSKPQRSLVYLLETYCGVTTNKLYQREDWRQRPLPIDMIEYARIDAHYLLYIAECLVSELKLQHNDNSASENSASLDDKFYFVSEAHRRSNALCLQLFTKELEASPGQSAASSIISRHLNDHGTSKNDTQFQDLVRRLCSWRDLMARMHDESLKYVLSDNAIVALAEKVPLTTTDICTTISQADIDIDSLNSNSTPRLPSFVVLSHLDDFPLILQDEVNNPDDIFQLFLKKHLGPHGTCPLSLYNYGLLSKSHTKVSKSLVSKNGYQFSKQVARKASRELFVQKFSCKSPVYHNCRIYANDGRLLCYCDRRKLEWYLQRDLAKIVEEDPPAIMLLFEPKGRPEDEGNDFYIQSKKNICVGCGEGNHYLRYRIIPSCYRIHFPEHLKSHRSHDIVLVCVDCHEKAHSAAEKYKKKVASEFGIPLFVHKVVNSSDEPDESGCGTPVMKLADRGVSPLELRTAAMALLRHGPRMPAKRREELKQVVKKYYGGREITEEDLEKALLVGMSPHEKRRLQKKRGLPFNASSKNKEVENSNGDVQLSSSHKTSNIDIEDDSLYSNKDETYEPKTGSVLGLDVNSEETDPSAKPNGSNGSIFATCSSKLSLLGHGPHGKQVVDFLLKEHGEDGVREFCQRWRQVFVEAIHPRFLPGGWDVTHSGRREFGDYSVYNPANKASSSSHAAEG